MSDFTYVSYVVPPGDADFSRITDLSLITVAGVDHLYSTTRYDGVLRHWDINGDQIEVAQDLGFGGSLQLGGVGGLAHVTSSASKRLLTGGHDDAPLQLVQVNVDGSFGTANPLTDLPAIFGGFQHGQTVTLADGTQTVYGAIAGANGIGQIHFAADSTYLGHTNPADTISAQTLQITASTQAEMGDQTYFMTVSATQNAVTTWAVGVDGSLNATHTIAANDGLWISAPTVLQVASVGDATYVLLGAAGSGNISVMELGPDGSLTMRDHVMDTLDTRFGGITSLEVVANANKTYVIAGGADDGVSIFVLLAGGLLVPRAHIEDTVDVGLDNISAISVRAQTNGLDIFVASSSEYGLSQLHYDTGLAGLTMTATLAGGLLIGSAGSDILQGHLGDDLINAGAGNDIIRDGEGSDVMTGGIGADLFILTADDVADTITDFTIGEDKIDLSLWPMLRDISQLSIRIRSDGMEITYGPETLIVQSANGAPIDYRDLTTADLIGASRLLIGLEPGYPGPATPLPVIGPAPDAPPEFQGGPNSMLTPLEIIAAGNVDALRIALGAPSDFGQKPSDGQVIIGRNGADQLNGGNGFDVILAGGGNDSVWAGAGDDAIFGRDGDDTLAGEDGADTIMGGDGNDTIMGGNGQDLLQGGNGDDVLIGNAGDDVLIGGIGADTFVFSAGTDHINDFTQGIDHIVLDPVLWTGLTSAEDVLFVYGSFLEGRGTVDFGDGNVLLIDGIINYATFADNISLF